MNNRDFDDLRARQLERQGRVSLIPFERGEVLTKLNKIIYREKALQQLKGLESIIERAEDNLALYEDAVRMTPHQRATYHTEKHKYERLLTQRQHLEEKILLMEESIKKDIEAEK